MTNTRNKRVEQLQKAFEQGLLDEETLRAATAALDAMARWETFLERGEGESLAPQSADSGDTITTGNISGVGIAIGRGAQAIVNYFRDRAEVKNARDHAAMVAMTKSFWVDGVLLPSLYRNTFIDLPFRAVAHGQSESSSQGPSTSHEQMPTATGIEKSIPARFFDLNAFERTMLLLGDAGLGKTTMLIEVARQAVARAEADSTQPIPIILNLATWGVRKTDFTDWLQDEILAKYNVPHQIVRYWITSGELIFLLDGLDEVPPPRRSTCVQAINIFQQRNAAHMIVCCRSDVYVLLDVLPNVKERIELIPLTPDAVSTHIQRLGGHSAAQLKTALDADPDLMEMAQSPLMLNIMLRVTKPAQQYLWQNSNGATTQRHQIFDAYIEQTLGPESSEQPLSPQQTKGWLSWLARQMLAQQQSIFLIEGLEPAWLQASKQVWTYILSTRFLYGVLMGGVIALLILLTDKLVFGMNFDPGDRVSSLELASKLFLMWVSGGIGLGMMEGTIWTLSLSQGITIPRSIRTIFNMLAVTTMIVGVSFVLYEQSRVIDNGLFYGLLFGVLGGLFFTLRGENDPLNEIQSVEVLQLSWPGIMRGVLIGIAVGAILGSILDQLVGGGLLYWALPLSPDWLPKRLVAAGLAFGPVFATSGLIFAGFRGVILDAKVQPNQGIWLSARNALYAGVLSLFVGWGLVYGYELFGHYVFDNQIRLGISGLDKWSKLHTGGRFPGLGVGILLGALAAFWHGGVVIIQHAVLRFILLIYGYIPANYAQFLDETVQRAVLRRVGGGYIFLNRLLLEYFTGGEVVENQESMTSSNHL